MNKNNAVHWIMALESRNYNQGNGYLHEEKDGEHYYCCLGVLCEVYMKVKGITDKKVEDFRKVVIEGGIPDELPNSDVKDWIGLSEEQANRLSVLNDGGVSFAHIAHVIRLMQG